MKLKPVHILQTADKNFLAFPKLSLIFITFTLSIFDSGVSLPKVSSFPFKPLPDSLINVKSSAHQPEATLLNILMSFPWIMPPALL